MARLFVMAEEGEKPKEEMVGEDKMQADEDNRIAGADKFVVDRKASLDNRGEHRQKLRKQLWLSQLSEDIGAPPPPQRVSDQ